MIQVIRAEPSEWSRYLSNVYSQFGEDGVIREVFKRIGTRSKECFEVGAADGKWFSNVRRLIDEEGWRGVLIEDDESNFPELDKVDGKNGTVTVHGRAEPEGPNSLDSILALCQVNTQPDLGVIDVDGQDYYLWNGMIKYRPRVMVVEYDPFAPSAAFVPDRNGAGQAGHSAICSLAASKGYVNVCSTRTNCIFVVREEAEKLKVGETNDAEWKYDGSFRSPPTHAPDKKADTSAQVSATPPPVIETAKQQEVKICALLSRPRFGLNVFFDCASEALAPWHIPIRSFYGVFWGSCMETGMEEMLAEGIDWILCLDYDSLFTAKHVQQLIDALAQNPNIDAIAALQPRRGRPLPLAVRSDGQMALTGGPVQVRTAHFGLTILKAEKLRKMKKPWFISVPDPRGGWGEGRLDCDIAFWGNWGDSGNNLYVHTGCTCGHVEEMVAHYEGDQVKHSYISEWRKNNGHQIKSFE